MRLGILEFLIHEPIPMHPLVRIGHRTEVHIGEEHPHNGFRLKRHVRVDPKKMRAVRL
jgi:hypothetical protein